MNKEINLGGLDIHLQIIRIIERNYLKHFNETRMNQKIEFRVRYRMNPVIIFCSLRNRAITNSYANYISVNKKD